MAFCGGGLFWRFRRFSPTLLQPEGGGVIMDWTMILALLVTFALVGYLAIALLLPEKFS